MKYLKKIPFILSILSFLTFFTSANAEIKVVASIKPIHSLVSYLMDGVSKPSLIVDGYASPHGFALKPSHAKMLQEADIIFWVGEDLENFLEKPLSSIAKKAEKIELMEAHGLNKLKFRERNIFDDHDDHGHEDGHKKKDDHDDHDDDGHKKKDDHGHDEDGHKKKDDHDDHGHKKKDDHDDHGHDEDGHKKKDDHDDHDDHDHDDHAKKEDGHDDHDDHDGHEGHHHGEFDPHIWLDPINAKVILFEMSKHLIENDPTNETTYRANLGKAYKEIDKLTNDVTTELNESTASIVFHDAYQYFEKDFGISASGAISLGDASDPSPARLAEIRKRVIDEAVECVLAEPQYKQGLVKAVVEGTKANTTVIDPLGVKLEVGPSLYENLIRNLAINLAKCF